MRAVFVISCLLLFAANSTAQPRGPEAHGPSAHGQGAHGQGGLGSGLSQAQLVQQLNLTLEQEEKLHCETPFQGRALGRTLWEEREKLNALIRDKQFSKEEIIEQMHTVNELVADFNSHRLERILTARDVLTEEQFKQFLLLRTQHSRKGMGFVGGPQHKPPSKGMLNQ
ncbi:hypothetical protein OAO01_03160 [Oligoflexia bacterium]|nr:hypothetical protein [Oligoflexia bacterium]